MVPLLLLLQSCASFHSKPLTQGAVAQALTVPTASALRRRSRELRNPLLRPVTLDPNRPLTPEEAAILAVLINPSLRAERDRIGISSAQLMAAGLLPNPKITLTGGVVTSGPGVTDPFGIGASWDFTSLITRSARRQAAKASLGQVRLDVAWAEWQVAEAAKAAVFNQVALEREVRVAEGMDQRLRKNLKVIQHAYDRHQRTILQLSAARTASSTAHATLLGLREQLARAQEMLLRALGLPAGSKVRVRSDIQLPARLALPSVRRLVDGLRTRRLDLRALRRGYYSQQLKVREAILAQFPRISLGLSRSRDNTGVYSIGFSAGIELPFFNRNQAAIAVQRATRRRLYDEYVNRVFIARSNIAMLERDVSALEPQIRAAQSALPDLERLVQTYRVALELGNADVLSYYTAWNNVSRKRLALIGLEQQLESDRISLELASGEALTPGSDTHRRAHDG